MAKKKTSRVINVSDIAKRLSRGSRSNITYDNDRPKYKSAMDDIKILERKILYRIDKFLKEGK